MTLSTIRRLRHEAHLQKANGNTKAKVWFHEFTKILDLAEREAERVELSKRVKEVA